MHTIDHFLNKTTMYRVVLYSLCAISLFSILFGFLGLVSYSGIDLLLSYFAIAFLCYFANVIFGFIFKVDPNKESPLITALILFLILSPLESLSGIPIFVLASVLAIGSKYIFTLHKAHIFNPAAISIFILGLFGSNAVVWWVATPYLLPMVIICGFLITRKVNKFGMFFTFFFTGLGTILIWTFVQKSPIDIMQIFYSWPIVFLGTFMLTEPFTTPPKYKEQIMYGLIVGILFGVQFRVGPLYSTPEFALIIGNIFSYILNPKRKITLTLKEKNKLSEDVCQFVFSPGYKLSFDAGQYMEWTLNHKNPDSRGSRRYFTIASSPTEKNIILTTKFAKESSTFKKELFDLNIGKTLLSAQIEGDFTLPKDPKQKIVWIAGGIGVTPYRSMAKFISDSGLKRDVVLLYSARRPKDLVYKNLFDSMKDKIGLKNIYIVNDADGLTLQNDTKVGLINAELIQKEILDYKERRFYISGPEGMVEAFEGMLKGIGVPGDQIQTDFFPGYM